MNLPDATAGGQRRAPAVVQRATTDPALTGPRFAGIDARLTASGTDEADRASFVADFETRVAEVARYEESAAERQINRLILMLLPVFAAIAVATSIVSRASWNEPENLANAASFSVPAIYSVTMWALLRRGIHRGYFKYLTMTVLVTTFTVMLVGYSIAIDWVHALRSVSTTTYFIVVAVSGLYKRPRLTIFTALLTSAQYLAMYLWATLGGHVAVSQRETFHENAVSWGYPVAYIPILLITGLIVAELSHSAHRMVNFLLRREVMAVEQQRELAEKQRELESTTDELHRQVAARSRELTNVLALVQSPLSLDGLEEGELFAELYQVIRPLGGGAMGAVYEVERKTDCKHLALKVATGAVSGRHAARFTREAEIGARIRHPNLVAIHDVGVSPQGAPYLVMDLEPAGSLDQKRTHFGDVSWAIPLLSDIAAGLQALHTSGVVHRDLKPANVLLAMVGRPTARIADYGIAAFEDSVDTTRDPTGIDVDAQTAAATLQQSPSPQLTRTNAFLGTPQYMSPEGAFPGKRLTTSSDLFSFGILAYEMLTGELPFESAPAYQALAGHRLPKIPPLDLPGLSPSLAQTISACLEYDPKARPTTEKLCLECSYMLPPAHAG